VLQTMRSSAKYIFWFIAISFVGGFLLYETSGLFGRSAVTTTTAIASVNGEDISYQTYAAATQQRAQEEEQRLGRGLTLDERSRIDDEVFEQLVSQILLAQEYKRRGIRVSNEEIVEAARYSPPPQFLSAPELQTEGRFDLEKYQRFLASPAARQQGMLYQLENYYRTELPQQKLIDEVAGNVYVTDARLWQIYRDVHDSAQVSFVSFPVSALPDSAVAVSDDEIRRYYDAHKKELERPGRAEVSVLVIPRTITKADSDAVRNRVLALRQEIEGGAKFEDVAKRESADTVSGANGGDLGRGPKGRFVKPFEDAAFALKPGELSQPVLTNFGYHLIKVDDRKGDTVAVRHLLLRIQQSDSAATRTDRLADSLSTATAAAESPAKFDSAAHKLGLTAFKATAVEGSPVVLPNGMVAPSVSAWAFDGAKKGESSQLFDSEDGYFLARLDSVVAGGTPPLDQVRAEVREKVAAEKKLDQLMASARTFAQQAASSTLEQAAQQAGKQVEHSPMFNHFTPVTGLGRATAPIGAAFTLPVGAVSQPVKGADAVVVLRVDKRIESDRAEWEKQKAEQRSQVLQALRQQRIRGFMQSLRQEAKVKDHRKELLQAQRREA
jgi:peptidyl-prolyl cis-trans isomerase D